MARRNLIISRVGDDSLHPTWLAQKDVARTWDFHMSYFGAKDAPPHAGEDGITFTKDVAKYKWGGMHVCLGKNPVDLDAYDYIAFPDDDVVVTTEGWNRAFELMRQYDLHAAQLALHPNSFYTINLTLQRAGTLLRYTNYVECMVPVTRMSVFKHISQYFDDPQSSWAIDSVIGHMLKDTPKSMAMLDAVPALHTRAHGVSTMYKDMTAGGLDYYQQEAAFLQRLGLTKISDRQVLGAVGLDGREMKPDAWLKKHIVYSYAVRAARNALGQTRIVSIKDGPEALERAMRMVEPRALAR
ncbi:MAG: hypothetical protein NW200_02130 [Hyphomonadaceae bacterium]|nr:hypothetical protein [Hyphomonadaceae bacterium]